MCVRVCVRACVCVCVCVCVSVCVGRGEGVFVWGMGVSVHVCVYLCLSVSVCVLSQKFWIAHSVTKQQQQTTIMA